jgi:hypothetical protein
VSAAWIVSSQSACSPLDGSPIPQTMW